jgi:hypothetical protein
MPSSARHRLVLYDVSTLYFETDAGDEFREPGSRRNGSGPQIAIGLLTDAAGFPLMVEAFEGNRAETATMLPTITAFMTAHWLSDVTIVADAGMISDANKKAIEAAGLSFILGAKIPQVPHVVAEWHRRRPDQEIPDGLVLTQPWPAGPADNRPCHFSGRRSGSRVTSARSWGSRARVPRLVRPSSATFTTVLADDENRFLDREGTVVLIAEVTGFLGGQGRRDRTRSRRCPQVAADRVLTMALDGIKAQA